MAELLLSAGAVPLGPMQILISAALVVLAGAISLALGLGLEKRLAIAVNDDLQAQRAAHF